MEFLPQMRGKVFDETTCRDGTDWGEKMTPKNPEALAFTDADLLRFENSETDGFACTWINFESKKALLARLRAAEKVCDNVDVGGFRLAGALIEWRRSKGEGGI